MALTELEDAKVLLKPDETEGSFVRLKGGRYLFVSTPLDGVAYGSGTVKLQFRNLQLNASDEWVKSGWNDVSGVSLTVAGDKTFFAASEFEYRATAGTAGVCVVVASVDQTTFPKYN